MVSCTECVHYNACREWAKHVNRIIDEFNRGHCKLAKALEVSFSNVDYLEFPFVEENKEALCENYEKAKVE